MIKSDPFSSHKPLTKAKLENFSNPEFAHIQRNVLELIAAIDKQQANGQHTLTTLTELVARTILTYSKTPAHALAIYEAFSSSLMLMLVAISKKEPSNAEN
jgi:hypothetical protein